MTNLLHSYETLFLTWFWSKACPSHGIWRNQNPPWNPNRLRVIEASLNHTQHPWIELFAKLVNRLNFGCLLYDGTHPTCDIRIHQGSDRFLGTISTTNKRCKEIRGMGQRSEHYSWKHANNNPSPRDRQTSVCVWAQARCQFWKTALSLDLVAF